MKPRCPTAPQQCVVKIYEKTLPFCVWLVLDFNCCEGNLWCEKSLNKPNKASAVTDMGDNGLGTNGTHQGGMHSVIC